MNGVFPRCHCHGQQTARAYTPSRTRAALLPAGRSGLNTGIAGHYAAQMLVEYRPVLLAIDDSIERTAH